MLRRTFLSLFGSFAFVVWVLTAPVVALAQDEIVAPTLDTIVASLPRGFVGTFQWGGTTEKQVVTICFKTVQRGRDASVVALGAGVYGGTDPTRISVRAYVDPETLRFEMWELDPVGSADFVTNGQHIGMLSRDLQSIVARWTTKGTGESGVLRLQAASRACPILSSS